MNSDRAFAFAVLIPIVLGILAAAYAYADFAQNGITSPSMWAATFLVGFYAFAFSYFISMTIYLWSQ